MCFPSGVQTLYDILTVPKKATFDEIKSAYRKLALIHHPDRNNGRDDSRGAFLMIRHAYDILSDTTSRAAYDNYLKNTRIIRKQQTSEGQPETEPLEYLKSQLNFILWETEDLVTLLKQGGTDRLAGGKTLRLWLLEILIFLDLWILTPSGQPGYLETLRISGETSRNPDELLPWIRIGDYQFDLRKRMNRFLENSEPADFERKIGGSEIRIADAALEALGLAYHYLSGINSVLKGDQDTLFRFRHTRPEFERQPVFFLPSEPGSRQSGELSPLRKNGEK